MPTDRLYPFQWNWDSAFVAMGFATFDPDRAWSRAGAPVRGPVGGRHGPAHRLPRADRQLFSRPRCRGARRFAADLGITQPPVAATACAGCWTRAGDEAGEARRAALFPALLRQPPLVAEARDPDGTGLVTMLHPWETGRDNSPAWDAPLAGVTPRVDVAALRKDKKRTSTPPSGQRTSSTTA